MRDVDHGVLWQFTFLVPLPYIDLNRNAPLWGTLHFLPSPSRRQSFTGMPEGRPALTSMGYEMDGPLHQLIAREAYDFAHGLVLQEHQVMPSLCKDAPYALAWHAFLEWPIPRRIFS